MCSLPLGRPAPQAGMVPVEGTPTLKSVRVSVFGCQSIVDNDVPFVGYEAKTNWVGPSRHNVLVSGLNHCVPLLSLFKEIIVLVIGVQQDIMKT